MHAEPQCSESNLTTRSMKIRGKILTFAVSLAALNFPALAVQYDTFISTFSTKDYLGSETTMTPVIYGP